VQRGLNARFREGLTIQGGLNNDGIVEPETAENREASRLLLPAEAAGRLGVGTRTLANWDSAGKITALRTLGGKRRYRESEVIALASGRAGAAVA
jgi:excisionase family DNA binding protein